MNKCKGILGLLFGHRFDGKYDDKVEYQNINLSEQAFEHLHILNGGFQTPLLRNESKYVHSVCRRCGQVVKRDVVLDNKE